MWKAVVLCVMLSLSLGNSSLSDMAVPICITNCVQCKQMFGRYFQGRACGDACISSNGRLIPDCNNPGTLGNYLKRYY